MKHLKLYEEYSSSQFFTTYEETKDWLDSMGIKKYTINDDLTVDVEGNVNLNNKQLTTIPVQFGNVSGSFSCNRNKLTSLQGAPSYVGVFFYCNHNQLTSLQGAPSEVGEGFDCSYNQLTSLQGAPSSVGEWFDCRNNKLTSLQGAPSYVEGDFWCSDNYIVSLFHINDVDGRIEAENNFLTIVSRLFDIPKGNPGYNVEESDEETLAKNFHEKVSGHPMEKEIIEAIKWYANKIMNRYDGLWDELEKLGYDESWFERNQNMDKHKDIFEF